MQEAARIEHAHVERLRALSEASVAINSSLTVEEILQLAADAARTIIGAARATVGIAAPDPRLRPLTAASPPLLDSDERAGVNFVQERERIIRQQQEAIRELSTPVLQVRERLLILPIIGVLDGQRARQRIETAPGVGTTVTLIKWTR